MLLFLQHFAQCVQHSGELRFIAKEDCVLAIIKHALIHGSLEPQLAKHFFFYGSLGHKVDDLHVALLPQTVDAGNALLQDGGIPRQVEVNHDRAGLQVQSCAACICREEHATVGGVGEVIEDGLALLRRHAAVQVYVAHSQLVQFLRYEARHALPLAEDDHLLVAIVEY